MRWNDESRNELRRLHAEGLRDPEIGERMGTSADGIKFERRKMGLPTHKAPGHATRGTRYGNGQIHPGGGNKPASDSRAPRGLPKEVRHEMNQAAAQPFEEGNPGGPGAIPTYKSMARQERVEALQELRWKIANRSQSDMARLSAINAAEDREIGKVRAADDGSDGSIKVVVIGGLPD